MPEIDPLVEIDPLQMQIREIDPLKEIDPLQVSSSKELAKYLPGLVPETWPTQFAPEPIDPFRGEQILSTRPEVEGTPMGFGDIKTPIPKETLTPQFPEKPTLKQWITTPFTLPFKGTGLFPSLEAGQPTGEREVSKEEQATLFLPGNLPSAVVAMTKEAAINVFKKNPKVAAQLERFLKETPEDFLTKLRDIRFDKDLLGSDMYGYYDSRLKTIFLRPLKGKLTRQDLENRIDDALTRYAKGLDTPTAMEVNIHEITHFIHDVHAEPPDIINAFTRMKELGLEGLDEAILKYPDFRKYERFRPSGIAIENFTKSLQGLTPKETAYVWQDLFEKGIGKKAEVVGTKLAGMEAPKLPSQEIKSKIAIKNLETGEIFHDPTKFSHSQLVEKLKITESPNLEKGWLVEGNYYNSSGEALKAIMGKTKQSLAEMSPSKTKNAMEKLLGFTQKKLGEEKGTAPILNSIYEFFEPLLHLPEKERYLTARYKTYGGIAKAERFTGTVYNRLMKFNTQEREVIFDFLDGQIPITGVPVHAQETAKRLRVVNDTIGQMLVDRGILRQEIYDAHKGKYIRYLYLRHILDEGDPLFFHMSKGGKLDASYLKTRKDLSTDQKAALGFIKDVAIAEPASISKPLTDIRKWDLLNEVSWDPEWSWQPSMVQVGTRRFGIDALEEEIQVYQRMRDKSPGVREISDTLRDMKQARDTFVTTAQKAPEDFVRLPKNKAYGTLSGIYIRKEIANDIMPVFSAMPSTTTGARAYNSVISSVDKWISRFKVLKTGYNVPTMSRNAISGAIQLNMSGVPFYDVFTWGKRGLQSYLKHDSDYAISFKNGLFKTNFNEAEINEIFQTFRKVQPGSNYYSIYETFMDLGKYYGKIDDVWKLAKFKERMAAGVGVDEAIREAHKWGMDYSLADPSVKLARRFLIPFASYTYKVTPLMYEALYKRPWVFAKYIGLIPASYELYKQAQGIKHEEWRRLKKELPTYIKQTGTHMVFPWKSNEGKWQWMNLEYFFPWQTYQQTVRDALQGHYTKLGQDVGVSNPYFVIGAAMITTPEDEAPRDPFTKRPIYNKSDDTYIQLAKTMEWIYNQWAPSMLTRKGALGTTIDAITKQPSKYGHVITPGEAISKYFGANIITVDPRMKISEMKGKRKALELEAARVRKDITYSSDEKMQRLQKIFKMKQELYK